MRFLSVCSGIECATQAWAPLGWRCVAASEIEKFPSALLAHHYPDVPNLGDMTQHHTWPDELSPDLLVGGTPCQSFSVAGLRGGLDDARGNLMLSFADIARRYRPRWLVWENVPGVLSSDQGQDFASLLGVLTGQRLTIPQEGWQNSGIVPGIPAAYGLAWRVLDAQYFGVPQRRRRVFVVGYLGDYRRAAAVLLERHSLQGHPAPSRKAGQGTAATVSAGAPSRRNGGSDPAAGHFVANTLLGKHNLSHGADADTYISHTLKAEGFDASEDGTGRGIPLVANTITARMHKGINTTCAEGQTMIVQDVADSLTANWHNSNGAKAGNNGGMVNPVLSVAYNIHSANSCAMKGDGDAQAAIEVDIARALDTQGLSANQGGTVALSPHMAVRRLTPRECERLQGYADDYTLVPFRGKPAADGPRYKAIGNGMAVPVMRWLGERINLVEALPPATAPAN